jgi:hypothetical protein
MAGEMGLTLDDARIGRGSELLAEFAPHWALTDWEAEVGPKFTSSEVREAAWELINALVDELDALTRGEEP